jgi:hypothetical protein
MLYFFLGITVKHRQALLELPRWNQVKYHANVFYWFILCVALTYDWYVLLFADIYFRHTCYGYCSWVASMWNRLM